MKTGGSAEEFVLIFECVSLFFFLKYFKVKDSSIHPPIYMFVHGIMCGMVLLTKINLTAFWIFPLLGIFVNLLLKKEFRSFILNILIFLGGILVIAIPVCLYLYTNNALQEAYDIYIVFNSRYADVQSVTGVIVLLIKRIYYFLRFDSVVFLLIVTGMFYFPVKHIGNKIGKCVLILSALSVYTAVLMTDTFQIYYPIPLLVYAVPGVLAVLLYLKYYVTITHFRRCLYLILPLVLLIGISEKYIFNNSIDAFLAGRDMKKEAVKDPVDKFCKIIEKEDNPTLLNLGFGLGNNVFTRCNIVPNVRYFVSPNLSYDIYPDMRDEQTEYVKNRAVQFIILPNPSYNYEYFNDLKYLRDSYDLVASDTIVGSIDRDSPMVDIYNLYKRKP